MSLECPNCKSGNTKKLSLVYLDGTADTDSDSFYFGTHDNAGYVLTSSTQQSRQAQRASPPERRESNWFAWYVIFAPCFFVLFVICWLSTQETYPWVFFWLWIAAASAVAIPLKRKVDQYNAETWPRLRDIWNVSFQCGRCGTVFRGEEERLSMSIPSSAFGNLDGFIAAFASPASSDPTEETKSSDSKEGLFELAEKYHYGFDVPVDLPRAASLYVDALLKGSKEAQDALELSIYDRLNLNDLEKLSAKGDSGAEAELGYRFSSTEIEPTKANLKRSLYWYILSSEHGNPRGTYGLASAYHFGEGVEEDREKAIELCKQCISVGYGQGQSLLDDIHAELERIKQAALKAKEWEEKLEVDIKAAQAGDLKALGHAGLKLVMGKVPRDRSMGLSFLRKAAEAEFSGRTERKNDGRADTFYSWILAVYLCSPEFGTAEELEEANEWLRKGYLEADDNCTFMFGEHLARGIGCKKDLIAAQAAFEYATERNNLANHELGLIYLESRYFAAAISQFTCALLRGDKVAVKVDQEKQAAAANAFRDQAERHLTSREVELARNHGDALSKYSPHVQLEPVEFRRRIRWDAGDMELLISPDAVPRLYLRSGGIYKLALEDLSQWRALNPDSRIIREFGFDSELFGEWPFGFLARPDLSVEPSPNQQFTNMY